MPTGIAAQGSSFGSGPTAVVYTGHIGTFPPGTGGVGPMMSDSTMLQLILQELSAIRVLLEKHGA